MKTCPKCNTEMDDQARFCPECGYQMQVEAPSAPAEGLMTIGGMETLDDLPTGILPSSAPTLEPDAVFADRYTIQEVVGRGGMGVVYKAYDSLAKKTVALKLIRPERLTGANAVDRLISEGITARDIRHPNIVAVYDVGTNDGQPFVSMEYLEGESLRSWHRKQVQAREDVSLKVAARIIHEVLDGLDIAHKAGVIHRDLKPENIVLMGEPTEDSAPLKILDFGIARAAGGALESGTGTGLGTPRYMAPEQITNADSVSPSADFYSLSVMFYELLVDVLPQGHWQPPSGGRSDVPAGIDKLIEKGLSNRPANRPQEASEYRSSLESAITLNFKKQITERLNLDADMPWANWRQNKIVKWGGLAAVALIVIAAVNYLIRENYPCMGLQGDDYDDCYHTFYDWEYTKDDKTSNDSVEEPRNVIDNSDELARLQREKEAAQEKADEEARRRQELEAQKAREKAAEERRRRDNDAWQSAQRSNTISAYRSYLNNWPSGAYASTARSKIADLKRNQNPYAYLSGQWKLDDGTYYNISISSSGSFSGSGRGPDGTTLNIRGNLSGRAGSYTISSPNFIGTANGQLAWDGACHIAWQGVNTYGYMVAGQIHVRHNPGDTVCPT